MFEIKNPYDAELTEKVSVSESVFIRRFKAVMEELEEFIYPNTSDKDIISRFRLQGYWSGNKFRVMWDNEYKEFYAENRW